MSSSTSSKKEHEQRRRTYGRPTLVKHGKLAGITAKPATSSIATDTAPR